MMDSYSVIPILCPPMVFGKKNTDLVYEDSFPSCRGQKYFNIVLVLQDEWLTIFNRPPNTCTCPLKAYSIKNIREFYVI